MAWNGGHVAASVSLQGNSSPALRDRLRTETRDLHGRVDTHFGAFDLTSLYGYRGFLEASAAALLPLENALTDSGVERLFPDWALRARSAAILDDLERTGGARWLLRTPAPLNFGGILGTMYVLEGSRLGAKVLLKTVSRSHGTLVAGATAYLSHGEGQSLWQTFLTTFERHAKVLDDTDSAIKAAQHAFHLFERAAKLETADRKAVAAPALTAQA